MSLFPNELPHLTYRGIAEKLLEWFEKYPQLRISNANRLSTQCQLIVKRKSIVQKDDQNWRIYIQSLKDMQEYWFIIEILGERLLQPPFLDGFTRSLLDSTHPTDSREFTPGRDTQFELYLAAIAARAGLKVDRSGSEGADWVITAPSKRWSLEAKRIKNFNKLEKHIKKAAKQITTLQIGGLIAIDISLAANPNCSPLNTYVPDSEIIKANDERTRAFINEKMKPITDWIGSASVGFVLLHDFVITPDWDSGVRKEPWGVIGLWNKVDLIAYNSSNRQYYDDLWHLFHAALPNL
jgi:hypothetical protein